MLLTKCRCAFWELWKTLLCRNSKYEYLGADIVLLILDPCLNLTETERIKEKGAVWAEKCSLEKFPNDFEKLWKTLPSRNSKYEMLGPDIIICIHDSYFNQIESEEIIGKVALYAQK